jgi:hypothetical protein
MRTVSDSLASSPSGTNQRYTVKTSWKFVMGILGLLFAFAGTLGCWYFGTGHEMRDRESAVFLVVICLGFAAIGLYVALWVFRARLSLRDEQVEFQGVWLRRTLRWDQVAGYRTLPQRNAPPVLMLFTREGHGRNLKISMMFDLDAGFYDWLRHFPDLDARDTSDSEQAILSDLELGTSVEERTAILRGAKRVQRFATIATFVLAAWGWLHPAPYKLVVCLLAFLPLAAVLMALRSNGLYRLDEERNDAHPNLAVPFIFPGFILALRAITDFEVVTWQRLGLIALAVGVLLLLLATIADPYTRRKPVTLIALLFCSFMYGLGSGLEANALLDRQPARNFSPVVVSRSVSHGRRTEYYLEVEAWGPHLGRNRVQVHRPVYDTVAIGDPVCIDLHTGALSIPWYTVDTCN